MKARRMSDPEVSENPQELPNSKPKRQRTVRSFPAASFEEAIQFAREIYVFGSGQKVRRLTFFDHLKRAPDSGGSRQSITNASKYNLIKGSYGSDFLEITPEALIVLDEERSVRERARARFQLAIEEIDPFKKLYDNFKQVKLPATGVLVDTVKSFGVSAEAADEAVDTFIVNARFVGILTTISGADRFVTLDHLLDSLPSSQIAQSNGVLTPITASETITSNTITYQNGQIEFEKTCFYIAPIGEEGSEQRKHSDLFLESLVDPALKDFDLKIIRADKVDKPGVITKQIIEYIIKSRLVIVDISFHNPNVFYELALRHMMRLPIVQIARVQDRVPFDINQVRTIQIDASDIYTFVPKMNAHIAEISSHIRRALDSPDEAENPISIYFPNLRAKLS